ncbi:MAG TPA: restriction endonuclease subunit S [Bacteroidales bacterium]|nr:restriction endonuclease subunit S [Bacteroidales bacterium]
MIEGWRTYRIEELAEKVGIGPFGSSIKVETFVEDGIPIISGSSLKNNKLEDGKYNFVTIDHANKLKNANVFRDDVIFTHAGNIGSVVYIPNNSCYKRYILSQRQFYLRCNKELLLPEFIAYFFKTYLGQKKLLANSSSVGVPSIARPVTYLRGLEVSIPMVAEQKRITSILSSLDDKIELNLQMNKTLEAIAQAIFKEWFVDFRFPGFDNELVDGLPKGWRKGKLLELFQLQRGYDLPAISRIGGEFPVVAASGISSYHNEFKAYGPGITTGRSGVIGNVYYIIGNFWPLNTSLFIKTFFQSTPLHAYHVLKSINLLNLNGGSAVPTLNRNDVHGLDQIIPPKEIINRYEVLASSLFAKIFQNSKENQTLIQIRDTILPKLMTGKIRVA